MTAEATKPRKVFWCSDCRMTGVMHCGYADECGGMEERDRDELDDALAEYSRECQRWNTPEGDAIKLYAAHKKLRALYAARAEDAARLDWLLDWLGMHDDVAELPCRDWTDNADARAAIDAARTDTTTREA